MEVVAVVQHGLQVMVDEREELERLAVVAQAVVRHSPVELVPHRLHHVHVQHAVVVLLAEERHRLLRLVKLIVLEHELGGVGIQVSVRLVEVTRLVRQVSRLLSVARQLHDFGLKVVELDDGRRVLNGLVHEAEGLVNLPDVEVVLTEVVVEPELDGWVLLLLVIGEQTHVLLHLGEHALEELPEDLGLGRVDVNDPLELVDERGHTLDEHGLHELDQVLLELVASRQIVNGEAQVGVGLGQPLHVVVQGVQEGLLSVGVAQVGHLDVLGPEDLEVIVGVARVHLEEALETLDGLFLLVVEVVEAGEGLVLGVVVEDDARGLLGEEELDALAVGLHVLVDLGLEHVNLAQLVGLQRLVLAVLHLVLDGLEDLERHIVVLGEVNGHEVGDPVLHQLGPLDHYFVPAVRESLVVLQLRLHERQVSQHVLVVLVVLQRIQISLPCFLVLSVLLVDDSVDVPAGEVGQVLEQGLLYQLISLRLPLLRVEDQSLERDRLWVVRVDFQHLVAELHGLFMLSSVVEVNHLLEGLLVLLGEARGRF
uniref:Uncharacterized protein n=1 Tax=Strombidium rassoulzadegani TaxID=1082188 RepID=A0A7S3FXT6_9SPIT|mmetsp:Transcript_17960/g.30555  ORF Transcript_17960/g.30555 Transcript_17960/m.30555 type:complete len:538 (+) Transcript_17960:884-2497(+)